MTAAELQAQEAPERISEVALPRGRAGYPSPGDWRDEVLYFLLPDRFSDGREDERPLLNRGDRAAARPAPAGVPGWRWDLWAQSGGDRWQGGTLRGIASKLDYIAGLGATAIWVGPVFKQRGHLNTFHGYGIQDFLDVDPRFGTRDDLLALVKAAHAKGLRIILDIIFNHSGSNWDYRIDGARVRQPGYLPWPSFYPDFAWRSRDDDFVDTINSREDGVWPKELQNHDCYTRAGAGDLGAGDLADPHAEHKRSDFLDLRDLNYDPPGDPSIPDPKTLSVLAQCYKYWIALTDCDGFRIDTLKHVSFEDGRNFCGSIKEFANRLGKHDFFLVGEIAGGDFNEDRYLEVLGKNLNAALDIGEMRLNLNAVAKGLAHPSAYFDGFNPGTAVMGSHRNLGKHHVSVLDDHDHVFGEKVRFSSEASSDHQIVAGVGLQLLTLGIPCIYYGSEQAFAGPEESERRFLPGWKGSDRYLREAMFGPEHPRADGRLGLQSGLAGTEQGLPGFGPFGTAGQHCFDPHFPTYLRIAAINAVRQQLPPLRYGRQYPRPISFLGKDFGVYGPGEIIAWSRILDDEEALCVLNGHGTDARGADVLVDPTLNQPGSSMTVVLSTAQTASAAPAGLAPLNSKLPVRRKPDGTAYVEIGNLPASEMLVLVNHLP